MRRHRREEVFEGAALDEDPRARAAVLAGVAEDRHRRRRGGRLDVGVGEDDVGRLAAQLQRHPLDRLRGAGGDPAADLGRAGEGDLGDVGVLDQPPAADAPRPGDDVQHALRQPRLERDLLQLERGQRRQLGRLEDDAVAGRERRRHLPGGDRQREVPGDDQADDAERLAEGHVDAAGDRDRLPEQPLRRAGVVAEGLDHHPDLAPRVADRLAGVPRLQRRQLLQPRLDRCGEVAQQLRPVRRRHRPPGRERRLRPRHRRVDLLDPGPRHARHHLLRSRLDHLDRAQPQLHLRPMGRSSVASGSTSGALRAASTSAAITLLLLVLLGVPDDAEGEVLAGQLDRLGQVVLGRPSRHLQPLPQAVDALVVVGPDDEALDPRRGAGERVRVEPHVVLAEGAGDRRGASRAPSASGRCWTSVPPSATFSSCMPRQIPSTGMSRSSARRASASSKASRSGQVPRVSGCGSAP